jgi:putative transposase
MIQAIKVKLYPSEDQKIYINKLLGTSRFVYNKCLDYKINEYKNNNKSTNISDTNNYVKELKNEFEWIKESHSKVLQQSLINLETAYKNFFKEHRGFPKFKSKHNNNQSCRFPVDAIMGVKGNRINIIKTLNDVHYKCSRQDEITLNKYQKTIKSGTLSKDKTGCYYFSILLDLPLKTLETPKRDIVGIDLGIKNFVIGSEGTVYENLKFKTKSKLKRLHKNLSRKQKGSNNRNKARIKLAKQYNKIDHQKEYYLHFVANQLLRENQTIVMEDLNVSGMVRNHKLAEAIQEVSWSRFKEILVYKAKWYNRNVIFISRWFPSSQKCSECGYLNKGLTLSDREWVCPVCGAKHDRDNNAAKNIEIEGLRIKNLDVTSSLGMSLPEVTLTESNGLPPRRSKKTRKMVNVII